jgi:RNA polymerase nonessential primary-like sigma factor
VVDQSVQSPLSKTAASVKPDPTLNHWAGTAPNFAAQFPRLPPLSYLQMSRLVRAAQAGDLDAGRTVWLHFARMTYAVINRFHVPRELFDDCLQSGAIGIARAIQKFDLSLLNDFSTYAWLWIRQSIQRELSTNCFDGYTPAHLYAEYAAFRKQSRSADSRELWFAWFSEQWSTDKDRFRAMRQIQSLVDARRFGLRPPRVIDSSDDPYRGAERADLIALIRGSLQRLKPRERDVLVRRYGLHGQPEQTLEEVGQDYGLTRERVRQIEAVAEQRMRHFLEPYVSLDPGWLRPLVRDPEPIPISPDLPVETESASSLNMPVDDEPFPETLFPAPVPADSPPQLIQEFVLPFEISHPAPETPCPTA